MKKIIFGVLLAAAADASAEPATNKIMLSAEYISRLAEPLRTNHAAVKAAAARVDAAAHNAAAVRTWEDPMVRVGGMVAREELSASDGNVLYGIDQKLPLFGKPKLARAVAEAETQVARANTNYFFQLRRLEFTKHLLQAAASDRLTAIGEQDLQWLDTIVSALQQRQAAGQVSELDVLKAQNERSKRADRLKTDVARREHERVTMNLMLSREGFAPWPEFDLPPIADPIPYRDQLGGLALNEEPKLKSLRQEITRAEASARLARRQQWPDISAGIEARNYTGNGSFRQGNVLLSMNLPWGNRSKYREDIRREESKALAAEWEARDYELSLLEQLHNLIVMIDAARREALLYRDQIIPRSRASMSALRGSWEGGRGMLTDVLEARRLLLEAETMYAKAVVDQYSAMAELVFNTGFADMKTLEAWAASKTVNPEKP